MKPFCFLPACLILSGCLFAGENQTSISAALSGIQGDLTNAGVVSAAGVGKWSEEQRNRFDKNVHALQCAQKNLDPVVALVSGPVTMQLTGSLTQSGSFSVSALTTSPVVGFSANASKLKAQQLSMPVQFIPLSSLPDAEMQREIEYAGALLGQSDQVRETEATRIVSAREALASHVLELQRPGILALCSPEQPVRPFVGTKKH